MISDPVSVFGYIAAMLALVFWLSGLPKFRKAFEIVPPVIFAYFVPTLSSAAGIIPLASPAYAWMTRYLLLVALLLLMIAVDLRSILKLGKMATFMMVAGTIGVIAGAAVSFLIFRNFLPPDAWKGFAALSGSWIGGTANMVAIAQSVGTPQDVLGPLIVVDTVVGYGWMGILLFLSTWQRRYDQRTGARTEVIEETNARLAAIDQKRKPAELRDLAMIIGLGFGGAVAAFALSGQLPALGDPTIISRTTWAVLIVVTGGLLLSFTPARRLEETGASRIGYVALYLLLGAIGAQADLRAIVQTPLYIAAGVVWILVHIAVMFTAARIVRAPLFFIATGSMANIGGAASAPVVAGVYHPAMAPVGLLMAVAGYILGIYGALACAWMLGAMAT
ncbi:MAG: DUF819 domain-containing protein [Gemmatimonadaceae bacterium]